jgi:hypothetical protein
MKSFFQSSQGKLVAKQGLPFILSLVLAEMFFELHSFSLELLCFSATWFVTGFIFQKAKKMISLGAKKTIKPA